MKHKTLALIAVMFLALCFLLLGGHQGPWTRHQIAGLAIMLPSFGLWGLARYQLGEAFAVRARAATLVTHGLYSKIRNPVYLFGGLFLAGLVVFLGEPYLFLLFLVMVPVQVARARKEAQVLREAFPEAYPAYCRRTWF